MRALLGSVISSQASFETPSQISVRCSPHDFGPEANGRGSAPVSRRFHCLLVDDESAIRDTTQRMLEENGLLVSVLKDGDEVLPFLRRTGQVHSTAFDEDSVRTVAAGLEARAAAVQPADEGGRGRRDDDPYHQASTPAPVPVDLVLLDIVMAHSNGADVCQRLVRDFGVIIPIVAMTANTVAASLKRYRKAMFFGLISKPFGQQDLTKKIDFMCARGGPVEMARQAEERLRTGMRPPRSLPDVWGALDRDLWQGSTHHPNEGGLGAGARVQRAQALRSLQVADIV